MPKNDLKKLNSPAGTPLADFKKLYMITKQTTDKIFIQIPSITLPEGARGMIEDCVGTLVLLFVLSLSGFSILLSKFCPIFSKDACHSYMSRSVKETLRNTEKMPIAITLVCMSKHFFSSRLLFSLNVLTFKKISVKRHFL